MEPTVSEMIWEKAAVEPMLMRERRQVIMKVMMTELSGMFHPGFTCRRCQTSQQFTHGGRIIAAYMADEGGERQAIVSGKRPCLSRHGGDGADACRCDIDDQDGCHD